MMNKGSRPSCAKSNVDCSAQGWCCLDIGMAKVKRWEVHPEHSRSSFLLKSLIIFSLKLCIPINFAAFVEVKDIRLVHCDALIASNTAPFKPPILSW